MDEVRFPISSTLYVYSNTPNSDWSQFYLSTASNSYHLGAESKRHVMTKWQEYISKPFEYIDETTVFFLNFSETHSSLYLKCENGTYCLYLRDRDGQLIVKEYVHDLQV